MSVIRIDKTHMLLRSRVERKQHSRQSLWEKNGNIENKTVIDKTTCPFWWMCREKACCAICISLYNNENLVKLFIEPIFTSLCSLYFSLFYILRLCSLYTSTWVFISRLYLINLWFSAYHKKAELCQSSLKLKERNASVCLPKSINTKINLVV